MSASNLATVSTIKITLIVPVLKGECFHVDQRINSRHVNISNPSMVGRAWDRFSVACGVFCVALCCCVKYEMCVFIFVCHSYVMSSRF